MRTSIVLPLLVMGVACYASIAMAQSPGTFTATGEMTTPRSGHTATLLTNGKVLITVGWSRLYSVLLDTAELYDPDSGVFTPAGSMTTPRVLNSATLLPDGRVLIVGPVETENTLCREAQQLRFTIPLLVPSRRRAI